LSVLEKIGPPTVLVLSICNICNFLCPQCAYRTPVARHYMLVQLFEKVLAAAATAQISLIRFLGLNEPTLHPKIGLFLRLAREAATRTHLISNGTFLLSNARTEAICANPPDILEISLDAFHPHTFKRVRGQSATRLEQLSSGIRSLMVRRLTSLSPSFRDTKIVVSFVLHPGSGEEYSEFSAFWRREGVEVRGRGAHTFNGKARDSGMFLESQLFNGKSCRFLEDRIFVDDMGSIRICNMDSTNEFILGRVDTEASLKEAWYHPLRIDIIRRMEDGEPHAQCASCEFCSGVV